MRIAAAIALALALLAPPLFAAFPGQRLILPVAGRVSAAGGREYKTTIWITNTTARPARASLSFAEGGKANPELVPAAVDLKPHQTVRIDNVTESLLKQPGKLGAVFIESDEPVVCSARVFAESGGASTGAGFAAVPIELAVGAGESTVLQGAGTGAGEFRYNIHLAETNRSSVQIAIAIHDAEGRMIGWKEMLLRDREAAIVPASSIAASIPDEASVTIRVVKGTGKIVAAGSQIAASGDPTSFEMSFARREGSSIPRGELTAYIAVALAVGLAAAAALLRRR